jgi:hypothetical protein
MADTPVTQPQGSTSSGDIVTQLSNLVRGQSNLYLQIGKLITALEAVKFPQSTLSYTVATLPSSPSIGSMANVTDGTSGLAWGATVTGGHSTPYLVWWNGTNWTVVGK